MDRSRGELGYSLVEVMVSIVLLSIAIIPMVSMFDAGLKSATRGGSYDQARALANKRLEEIKALPYKKPETTQADSVVERYPPGSEKTMPNEGNYSSKVKTAYQDVTPSGGYEDSRDPSDNLPRRALGETPTTRMKVMVTVTWNGNSYTATGLVSSGTR